MIHYTDQREYNINSLNTSMMPKITALLPSTFAALSLIIFANSPQAQAASFNLPTPTVGTFSDMAGTRLDTGPAGEQAYGVTNVVVEIEQDVSSYVYDVCFEYGAFTSVYDSNRNFSNPVCPKLENEADFVYDSMKDAGQAEFQQPFIQSPLVFAERAASGPTPQGMPTSDGILTALNNTLQDADPNNDVVAVQGDFYFNNSNLGTFATNNYLIPYEINGSNVFSYRVTYNETSGLWEIDGINSSALTDLNMFVRFFDTGERINVSLIPEPSSIVGVLLTGAFMLTKVKARRR